MGEYPTDAAPAAASLVAATVGLTALGRRHLDETRPWLRLMSIVCFIGAGMMALVGLAMLMIGFFGGMAASAGRAGLPLGVLGGAFMGLLYFVIAIVYVLPGFYLWQYAAAIARLKTSPGDSPLEDALKHQKSFWRFVGIVTIIGLVLTAVGIMFAVAVGLVAAMAGSS